MRKDEIGALPFGDSKNLKWTDFQAARLLRNKVMTSLLILLLADKQTHVCQTFSIQENLAYFDWLLT